MLTRTALGLGAAAVLVLPACAAEELVLAMHGRSAYRIVVPDERSAAIDYAAAELQRFLHDVSSATLPIVPETQAAPGPAFLLGRCERVLGTGLVGQARRLGEDGVLIRTVGQDVVLLGGGDRGQLYSVYTFLERYAGCRFLAADCTVTPKQAVLAVPLMDYRHAPPFIYREELYGDIADWDFAARLRLNGSNMNSCIGRPVGTGERIPGVLIYPFVHSSCALIPEARYFATHPEYFGLVNGQRHAGVIGGQLCLTNPDVLRICTDQALAWLEQVPTAASVDISQNDAYPGSSGACECENCARVVEEEGAQSGPWIQFVNAIADVVAERHPGKYVDTLAYDYTIARAKVTTPRDNVIIRLCQYACYFHGVREDPLGTSFRNAIDDWRAVAKNLFIWHYGVNFWHYLAPNPNLEALVGDIRHYTDHGVNGMMLQGNLQSPGGELADFRQYLAAQLMWDPTQDPMVIRREFCEGYYGPASAEAMEFLALMDRLGETTQRHIPTNGWNPPDVATPEFVAEGLSILERGLAKTPDQVHRNRVGKLMLPLWYVQLAWPDVYGVSKEQGRETLARFRDVIRAWGITTISEGPPNAEAFIASMEARYGALEGDR